MMNDNSKKRISLFLALFLLFMSLPEVAIEAHALTYKITIRWTLRARKKKVTNKNKTKIKLSKKSLNTTTGEKEFVYLTPDAEEDLEDVSDDKIYIIGGIVDRTVIKNLSMNRVTKLKNENNCGIKIVTKKLPLLKHIKNLKNIVLNINTVVEILSLYADMDNDKKDWKNVLERALPKRKFDNKI